MNAKDYEEYFDQDEPLFQPLRKQNSKQSKPTDRRQKDKEWGRAMRKFHKERERYGKA